MRTVLTVWGLVLALCGCVLDAPPPPDVQTSAAGLDVAPPPRSECRLHAAAVRVQPTWRNANYDLPDSHGIAYHPEVGLGIVSIPSTPGTQEVAIMDAATGVISTKFAFHHLGDKDQYSTPRGLFIDATKRILVPMSYHHTVRVLDATGTFDDDYAKGTLGYAPDVSASSTWIAVANANKGVDVMALDGTGHKHLKDVRFGDEAQVMPGGYGVRFDTAGNLWTGASSSNSVIRIAADELGKAKPTVQYFEIKDGAPDTMGPYGLAFDKFGDLYVSFHGSAIHRVRITGDTVTAIETIAVPSVRHLVVVGCDLYFADYKKDYGVLKERPAPPTEPAGEDEDEDRGEPIASPLP